MDRDSAAPVGWNIYFLGEEYSEVVENKPFIHDVIDLGYDLLQNSGAFNDATGTFLDSTKAIEINYDTLQASMEEARYGELLRNDPITTLRCLGLAAFKVKFGLYFETYRF